MLREKKALQELKEIMRRDYGVAISDAQAEELGTALLRLTRVAIAVIARTESEQQVEQQNISIKEN